jgi:DNA-binding MarR family transcriptional regulator
VPFQSDETPVVKLFFDSFSQRVSSLEQQVKSVVVELENLKTSRDRSEISDLVLLERLQRTEGMLVESLGWIKKIADAVEAAGEERERAREEVGMDNAQRPVEEIHRAPVLQNFRMPGGEAGSLSSITTPTELQVLALLSEQGAKSAPEIGQVIGRSREHSARLMKKLFQEGYVRRDQTRIPFRYSVVERVRASFRKPEEKKQEAREEAAPVQA